MKQKENTGQPVFRLRLDGFDVTVRFRAEDTHGVKEGIRDILTRSLEERIMENLPEADERKDCDDGRKTL